VRALARRSERRVKKYLEAARDGAKDGLSLLERRAAIKKASAQHQKHLESFAQFCSETKLPLATDSQVDNALVRYFNGLFFA
jgi:hypothetical protein